MIDKINLANTEWSFTLSADKPDINCPCSDFAVLPSTVSQLKKSPVSNERNDGYLSDPYRFDGYAVYERMINVEIASPDEELFLVLERTRTTEVWIDGVYVGTNNSLCAPHRYNITDFIKNPSSRIRIAVNNVSCPVPGGHMTSPDTQTNWLGITGEIYIERSARVRPENVRVFPNVKESSVTVTGKIIGGKANLIACAEGFPEAEISAEGDFSFTYKMDGARLWSEFDPIVYTMKITCGNDVTSVSFGLRQFETKGTEFLLNGERIFLRGKHDGMIFPLTGAAPTDKESWLKTLKAAREHGINHYRFHTCCPPDAAFCAADELGIYMEPELPFWGTVEDELTSGQQYLIDEGFRILDSFGNHPSFFGMSMGNELWGSKERLNDILGNYKAYDNRHLYTQGSNNFQFWPCTVENDDFFVGVRFSKERLFRGSYAMCDAPLGAIQTDAPNSNYNYNAVIRPSSVSLEKSGGGTIEIQYGTGVKTVSLENGAGEFISQIPVVSHEVGQYFMYPDYNEIEKYTGVLKPYNLEIFRERLENAGLLSLADKYFRASGRFAAECYKNEIETALRSKELSGFQLLDIQDFTGQGTALVGILNSFMESKGVISPKEWRSFCSERVILGCLPAFVFKSGEEINMPVMLYSYARDADVDPAADITLTVGEKTVSYTLNAKGSFKGGVFELGSIKLKIPETDKPSRAVLRLSLGDISNEYVLWIYPETEADNSAVIIDWSKAKELLARGENVLFMPDSLPESKSIEGTYCTDFWNYPMFNSISVSMNKPSPVGTLGLLIDNGSAALSEFPSEIYSTAQWYDAVTDSRTAILDGININPIVRTIDNCGRNHSLGTIFEVNAGGGKLLVCTARLDKKSDSLPCRQLLKSLSNYVKSNAFSPADTVDTDVLDKLFTR
ncbi:MAG: beta-glucuronidase [Oscillospiraceae bacterium]|nr:beta-glucuronidase [Oscillospiraceae bacterium]